MLCRQALSSWASLTAPDMMSVSEFLVLLYDGGTKLEWMVKQVIWQAGVGLDIALARAASPTDPPLAKHQHNPLALDPQTQEDEMLVIFLERGCGVPWRPRMLHGWGRRPSH